MHYDTGFDYRYLFLIYMMKSCKSLHTSEYVNRKTILRISGNPVFQNVTRLKLV